LIFSSYIKFYKIKFASYQFRFELGFVLLLSLFFLSGCEKTLKVKDDSSTTSNTLNKDDLGHETGNVSDYFYDFSSGVDAQYRYYSEPYYSGASSTISKPDLLDPSQDTLNFKTFPDYLVDITPSNINLNATLYVLDEKNAKPWCSPLLVNTDCKDIMDFNNDSILSDGIDTNSVSKDTTFTISWVDLDFMKWDSADARYKVGLLPPKTKDSTLSYTADTDIYVSKVYIGVIDTLYKLPYTPVSNLLFIDRDEWELFDTTFYSSEVTHSLEAKFNYSISVLGEDSLMFKVNGDCDRDGEWDAAETYLDYGSDWCPDNKENGAGACNAILEGAPCNCLDEADPDYIEGSDPNGDNWRDCGWDTVCSVDPGYTGADFNGTEGNGIWDQNEGLEGNLQYDYNLGLGEYFEDRGNGVVDVAEFYFDADSNGVFDSFTEPFEDRNCNGVLDLAESEDVGNGIWDADEAFSDIDLDGQWDSGEPLFIKSEKPVNFLVNYPTSDLSEGVGFKAFKADTSINIFTHYNESGLPQFQSFDDLIVTVEDSTIRTAVYADVDSIVSVYTNKKIESLGGSVDDYHVTKVKWFEPILDDLAIDTVRAYDYDYHIFKVSDNGDILKITHPEYFNHYGYFEDLKSLEEGVWEQSNVNEEVFIYTKNGQIRAEEHFYHDTTIVTALATYRVENEFKVEFCDGDGEPDEYCSIDRDGSPKEGEGDDEVVIIPIKQLRYKQDGGLFICTDNNLSVADPEECSADSIMQNIFKIVRTKTLTMVGNGVEMGTRNTIWLAEGLGIVKDKLEVRWSEAYWETPDSGWKEYSRLELQALRSHDPFLYRNIFSPLKVVGLHEFGDQDGLDYDPYSSQPSFGLHRLRYAYEK